MDANIFKDAFSFCFSSKELIRAVISLVRKVSTDLWAQRKVKKKFRKRECQWTSWFSFLSVVKRRNVDIATFRNFFLTFLQAQRSDESFQTREMTARTSSFTLKQKDNPTSKKQLSIFQKTVIFRDVFGSSKSRIFRFRSSRWTKTSDISNFRERIRSMCNETHLWVVSEHYGALKTWSASEKNKNWNKISYHCSSN